MLTYNDEQARAYTEALIKKQNSGLLQGWVTSQDMKTHCRNVLDRYWGPNAGSKVILDVGCGTGEMLFQAGERWPDAKLYGVNYFPSQVGISRLTELVDGVYTGDFEFDTKLMDDIVLDSGKADLIMFNYTLGHFMSLDNVFKRAAKLLADDGVLGIYDISRKSVVKGEVLGYKLWSRRQIMGALIRAGFQATSYGVPRAEIANAMKADAEHDTVEDVKAYQDFATWTEPVLFVARRE